MLLTRPEEVDVCHLCVTYVVSQSKLEEVIACCDTIPGILLTSSAPLFMQAIFIPAVGILGNDYDRVGLICIGSLVWGAMSVGFGFAHDLKQVRLPVQIHRLSKCNCSEESYILPLCWEKGTSLGTP